MHDWLCVCDQLEPLDLRTRVAVLTHQAEITKTTNTGRLVALALVGGEIRIRGRKGAPMSTEGLVLTDRRPLMLYPTADALLLTPELVAEDPRPVTLIVPDGNWRQARKVTTREPTLARVQRVRLPEGPPSRYRLRSHANPLRVSTFEAVARALGILEGPGVQAALEHLFDVMVERTLWTRGELLEWQVTGGLPPRPRKA
jgi:DTW domain-containing protein YfiP